MIRKFLILTTLVTIPFVGLSNSAKAHEVYPSNNGTFWSVIFGSNAKPVEHRHHTHKKVVYKKQHKDNKRYGYYHGDRKVHHKVHQKHRYYHKDNRYGRKHYKKSNAYHPKHKKYYHGKYNGHYR